MPATTTKRTLRLAGTSTKVLAVCWYDRDAGSVGLWLDDGSRRYGQEVCDLTCLYLEDPVGNQLILPPSAVDQYLFEACEHLNG